MGYFPISNDVALDVTQVSHLSRWDAKIPFKKFTILFVGVVLRGDDDAPDPTTACRANQLSEEQRYSLDLVCTIFSSVKWPKLAHIWQDALMPAHSAKNWTATTAGD
eukprot:scaffold4223_cov189-Amphora_coffeaeformis.AAC.42